MGVIGALRFTAAITSARRRESSRRRRRSPWRRRHTPCRRCSTAREAVLHRDHRNAHVRDQHRDPERTHAIDALGEEMLVRDVEHLQAADVRRHCGTDALARASAVTSSAASSMLHARPPHRTACSGWCASELVVHRDRRIEVLDFASKRHRGVASGKMVIDPPPLTPATMLSHVCRAWCRAA